MNGSAPAGVQGVQGNVNKLEGILRLACEAVDHVCKACLYLADAEDAENRANAQKRTSPRPGTSVDLPNVTSWPLLPALQIFLHYSCLQRVLAMWLQDVNLSICLNWIG